MRVGAHADAWRADHDRRAPFARAECAGRGYGQLEAESRLEREPQCQVLEVRPWCSGTHRIELDNAPVLHFRSTCEISDVSGGGVSRLAPERSCARKRGDPALSPVRPLPPARPPSLRADHTAPGRGQLSTPSMRCSEPPARSSPEQATIGNAGPSPGACAARVRLALRGGQRRAARRRSGRLCGKVDGYLSRD